MNRRFFLKNTSAASFVFAPFAVIGKIASAPDNYTDEQTFALEEMTIESLQKAMQTGKYTSVAITTLYRKRIEAIDKKGPAINAVIELNPDALLIAAEMDRERRAGKIRGPLHGIPVLIKDNIDTADKMMTTAGSLALAGNRATKDAFILTRLREAGAVILGKTNLSEWANFRSTRSTSGWSSRVGQTKNPYILDRSPSGSSSGSGAAVAANLCAVAVGTETNGSIIAPASFNGVVGIKPTVGLVSRSGIIPISKTQDTAGPMARTVRDAAVLLGVLAGPDKNDEITTGTSIKANIDYTSFLDAEGLKGKIIGVEKSFLQGHEGVVALYRAAIDVMKSRGATVIEVELLQSMRDLGGAEFAVLQYEFKDGVNNYLAHANAKLKSLKEVIDYNRLHEKEAMPYFKQELLESSNAKGDLTSKEYTEAVQKSQSAKKIIDELMEKNKLNAIAGVSIGPACCIDLINGDYDTGFYFCSPAAMAGYPHMTVPMGTLHGLPVGFSLMTKAFKEPELIRLGYSFEQATKHRKAPEFIQTVVPGSERRRPQS